MSSKNERRRRIARAQLADIHVSARGADVTSTENQRPDHVKQKHVGQEDLGDVLGPALKALGLVGTFAGGTLKGFKQNQDALGEGSRDSGFQSGQFILRTVVNDDGSLSAEALEGAKDAAFNEPRSSKAPDYERAYKRVWRETQGIPTNHDAYARTRNAYRGGIIAAVAIVYAAVTGHPMLTRMKVALAQSGKPGWAPADIVYAQRDSPAHSVLDAVKEITERALDGARGAVATIESVEESVGDWMGILEQAGEGALYGGPDEAAEAGAAAKKRLESAHRLTSIATSELSAWEREL